MNEYAVLLISKDASVRGTVEGGDTVWLDHDTRLVGHGYRTGTTGIAALREAFPDVEVIALDLPHWVGAAEAVMSPPGRSRFRDEVGLAVSPANMKVRANPSAGHGRSCTGQSSRPFGSRSERSLNRPSAQARRRAGRHR